MKLQSKFLASLFAGALLVGSAAQAQDMTFFRIGTGSAGGTYFPIGGIIANAISNPPGSRPCDKGGSCGVPGLVAIAQSTNASAHNVTAIQAGQMEAGLTGAATLYQAFHGVGKFEGNQKPDLRVIANLFPEDMKSKRKTAAVTSRPPSFPWATMIASLESLLLPWASFRRSV